MVRILVADLIHEESIDTLRSMGHDVYLKPTMNEKEFAEAVEHCEILIVRSKKVTKAILQNAGSLILIIRAGSGVDTIDVNEASKKGIFVCNTPGMNSNAVAELAFGHILACDRFIPTNSMMLRNGEWNKSKFANCFGLGSRTLGLIGCGNIAKNMIRIAKGFGMHVIVCSKPFSQSEAQSLGVEFAKDMFEVASSADVISVHIPYIPGETHHVINRDFFNTMKDNSIFVNTSRGEIVDTEALKDAIKNKGIKVGLDVFENEPTGGKGVFIDTELANLVCSCTCHIGASTIESLEKTSKETIRVIDQFLRTGRPDFCVNVESILTTFGISSSNNNDKTPGIINGTSSNPINLENYASIIKSQRILNDEHYQIGSNNRIQ